MPQHSAVRACAAAFAQHGRSDALVILESTVRPGFVDSLRPALGHGGDVALAYAPERMDPRLAAHADAVQQPRLVAGVDPRSEHRAACVMRRMGIDVRPVALGVAEYAKLLENSYRLLNVAFVDQFAALCRADGVDPRAVIAAAATKAHGFMPFWPGVGAGGHCIPVDPTFLLEQGRHLGVDLSMLEGALTANQGRAEQVAASIADHVPRGGSVLVVGLTYRAGVADLRESAAVAVARSLQGRGCRVLCFDELVGAPPDLEGVPLDEGLAGVDAVALLVPQSVGIHRELAVCAVPLLDATGTLAGGVAL